MQTEHNTVNANPRIYVADLAAYNAGHLHGVWIDATQDMEAINEQVRQMLAASPVLDAEEYAIHDSEAFGSYTISENEGLEIAHIAACFMEEFPEFGAELLAQFGDIAQAREAAEENYGGCYPSLADYAQELTEEAEKVPPSLAYYIDYERMARDMELSGDVFTIAVDGGAVHVFWCR